MSRIRKIICLMSALIIGSVFATVGVAEEIDDGSDADGRVIWPKTLAERCNLSSSDYQLSEDCYDKMVSDYKLGVTPSGISWNQQTNQIFHEQIKDTLALSLQRLIESGTHKENNDVLAGKYTKDLLSGLSAADDYEGDANDNREVLEQINKLNLKNFNDLVSIMDSTALLQIINKYEMLFFQVIPERSQTMIAKDAAETGLRKDRTQP